MKTNDYYVNSSQLIEKCLKGVPFVSEIKFQEMAKDLPGPDFIVILRQAGRDSKLIIEAKAKGEPRQVKDAVNQLFRYKQEFPGAYPVVCAPYISAESSEICRKNNVGYIDSAGNCFIAFENIFIERNGNPNPNPSRRGLRSMYQPRSSRILRVLMCNPGKVWKLAELKQEAAVSIGQVYNVKQLLLDKEWVKEEQEGIRLFKPEALLKNWAEAYTFRKNTVYDFYTLKSLTQIEEEIASKTNQNNIRYALTAFSGAARLAPAVRYARATVYISEDINRVAALLDLKPVTSGANITLMLPYDDGVFYGSREVDGLMIASPIQIYLDLKGFRGRGEEAAESILSQVIQKSW